MLFAIWPAPVTPAPLVRMEESHSFAPVRAARYTVAVPLKYRRVGEQEWHTGVVENISQTGIFFRADRRLTPEEVIEINFTLRAIPAADPSTQPCTAIVVRTDRSRVENKPAFGTRFLD
jgi:hypothetical protein